MAGRGYGVDLGGTAIKAGAVEGGHVLTRDERETPHEFEACMDAIAASVLHVAGESGAPARVGLGLPGVVSPRDGRIAYAPNLGFLESRPTADALRERLGGAEVLLENDANVAALGEARHGAGRAHPDFLLATLGTGIGGGIVLGGELFRGPGGMAAEFGHIPVGHERLCGCGARGCLEAAVSARSLVEWAREEGLPAASLPDLADMARRNDKQAASLFRRAGALLGEACAQVALLLDLRVFLIGGGGAPVLYLLRPAALQVLAARAFGRDASDFTLDRALLGNDAGLIGASTL
ncbi:MAG TPA: ROK family protein [Planctomycetota bacterium]